MGLPPVSIPVVLFPVKNKYRNPIPIRRIIAAQYMTYSMSIYLGSRASPMRAGIQPSRKRAIEVFIFYKGR